MADIYRVNQNVSRLAPSLRPPDLSPRYGQRGLLTEADMAIMPHIDQAKDEFEKKRGVKGFLTKLFEVLQTGNYITANVADSLYDSWKQKKPTGEAIGDMLREAWKGLSHQEKTTFSDVIKQNAEEYGEFLGLTGEQWSKPIGLFGIKEDPETKFGQVVKSIQEQITLQGAAGLAGDIFLDPLTYVNPLSWVKPLKGASKAALSAGGKYVDDVVRLDLLNKNMDVLTKLVGGADAAKKVKTIAEKGGDMMPEIAKVIQNTGNIEFSRYLDDLVRTSMKKGTLRPMGELQEGMRKGVGEVTERFAQMGDDVSPPKSLDELTRSVNAPDAYAGAGTRARQTAFRGEVNVHEGQPNVMARTFEHMGQLIKGTVGDLDIPGAHGATLSDAWWAIMNHPKSPVGLFRKSFGIRNPYQKLQHQKTLQAIQVGKKVTEDFLAKANPAVQALGNEDMWKKAVNVRIMAESAEFAANKAKTPVLNTAEFIAQKKDTIARLKVSPEELVKIDDFWKKLDPMFSQMRAEAQDMIDKGLLPDFGSIVNYLPKYQQHIKAKGKAGTILGTQTPGYTEATKFTAQETVEQMAAQMRVLYKDVWQSVADETGDTVQNIVEKYIKENNIAQVNLSLPELLNKRIIAHARTMQRGKMVEQFREFGIRIRDLDTSALDDVARRELQQSLGRVGGGIPSMGLYTVQDPGLKGYLFDQEIADLVTKTYTATASDDAITTIKTVFGNSTKWWKAWATATSGFHMRNHFSNQFTGFMAHGMGWFNPKKEKDASILSHYVLHPDKYQGLIAENIEAGKGYVAAALNQKLHGYSYKQLGEIAKDHGIVGWGTFFSDVEAKVGTGKGRNLLKKISPFHIEDNVVLKGSRTVGDLFETKAKLQSFIMSFDEVMSGSAKSVGLDAAGDAGARAAAAIEWAALDTKKWFIDYGDLTEFEQKHMKGKFPFYTWLRKNMANQLNAITMYPGAYALAADVTEEFTLDGFPFVLQPEWQKELGYIPVSQDKDNNYMMFFPNLPYQDLNKIPFQWEEGAIFPSYKGEKLWEELASNAHPLMKWITEKVTGMNTFKRREMLDHVKAPGLMQFFAKSPHVIESIDGIMRRMGNDNGLRINVRNGRVEIDEMVERTLTTFLPVLRSLEKGVDGLMDVMDWINPAFEATVEAKTGRRDDYEDLEDFLQNLSFFGGMKSKMFQEEYEAERANEEIEERAQELQRQERQQMHGYERRVQDFLQSQTERRQRRGLY